MKSCLIAFLAAAAATLGPVQAEQTALLPPTLGTSELYGARSGTGLALRGFDPVSYRLGPEPAIGLASITLTREGLVWRFTQRANRAAFERDPESFLPRFGGFDAAAMAEGRLAESDPTLFAIRDGNLYLFRLPEGRAHFMGDPDAPAHGEASWPALRAGLVVR